MKLIVGLGNPGKQYKNTRHNIGFAVIEAIAAKLSTKFSKKSEFKSEIAETHVDSNKIILAKPQTFMNLSGESVKLQAKSYKLSAKDIWVISDDLDLPVGRIRIRQSGSSGGHNGLQSIEDSLASQDYWHIRLGIGPVGDKGELIDTAYEAAEYVLEPFTAREQPLVNEVVRGVSDYLTAILDKKDQELSNHSYSIAPVKE